MNKKIIFVMIMVGALATLPLSHGLQYHGKTYQEGSECDFMLMNHVLAPAYDLRQVQSLMLFDAGRCDPVNPVNLNNGIPYYVITEIWDFNFLS